MITSNASFFYDTQVRLDLGYAGDSYVAMNIGELNSITPNVSVFIPANITERLRRAVDAFNAEMNLPDIVLAEAAE